MKKKRIVWNLKKKGRANKERTEKDKWNIIETKNKTARKSSRNG